MKICFVFNKKYVICNEKFDIGENILVIIKIYLDSNQNIYIQ